MTKIIAIALTIAALGATGASAWTTNAYDYGNGMSTTTTRDNSGNTWRGNHTDYGNGMSSSTYRSNSGASIRCSTTTIGSITTTNCR